jgi:SAM-dependent methyltransferase
VNKSIYQYALSPAPRYFLRLSILQQIFKKYLTQSSIRFMEIGAGKGDVSAYLIDHDNVKNGLIVEQSEKAAVIIRDRLGKVDVDIECADILTIEAEAFDCVLSFEVLEHIPNDIEFMLNVNKRLNQSGLWFISVPAYMRKWQKQDEFSGHVRRYEEDEIREKLCSTGFEILELLDYGFPLTSIMRPFRDRYYKSDDGRTMLDKTLDSGTEKRGRPVSPTLMWFLLLPFTYLQKVFANKRWGDGFIVVARKSRAV